MRHSLAAFILVASVSGATAQGAHWRPTTDQIAVLEKEITLSNPKIRLGSYARHYWGENTSQGQIIRGEFLGNSPSPGVYISTIAVLPAAGGGCKFVDVTYNVVAKKTKAACHAG